MEKSVKTRQARRAKACTATTRLNCFGTRARWLPVLIERPCKERSCADFISHWWLDQNRGAMMRQGDQYLCADLIRISTGDTAEIGSLELISAKGCTVTVAEPLPIGTPVELQCVECPQGKLECTGCRFAGRVRARNDDSALGSSLHVEFENRVWSASTWQPRHLADFPAAPAEGDDPLA